jgi:integrase
MPPKSWPYVKMYRAANGSDYAYFRPTGKRLEAKIGTPAFRAEYATAMAEWEADKALYAPVKPAKHSFAEIIADYTRSTDYARLAPESKRLYARQMDWMLSECGGSSIKQMTRKHVNAMLESRAQVGAGTHNIFLAVLRVVVRHAILTGIRQDDPTLKIRSLPMGEHRTWAPDEIAKFEARYPPETRERLAFSLGLFTGQRLGDIAKMTWADLDMQAGTIRVIQEKTGTKLTIPIHADLAEVIAAHRRDGIALVKQADGSRLSKSAFSTMMRKSFRATGLPSDCVFHGLRKSAAVRLAEVGCTTLEIAAVTGHKSLKEIERYTKGSDQIGLAKSAFGRLELSNRKNVVSKIKSSN